MKIPAAPTAGQTPKSANSQLSSSPTSPSSPVPHHNRLAGIDGLRAVAALWVVFFHINAFSHASFPRVPLLEFILRSGSTGVSLFLVLSGFCLYVPFAGGRAGRFKAREFLLRRCHRLMPAYYASLPYAIMLIAGLGTWIGLTTNTSWPNLTWQVLTHITLTHTLFPTTFYALNGAYWSLGLEWQLYLALPLLVWGVRRFGLAKTVAAAALCNVIYRVALAVFIGGGAVAPDSLLASAVLPNLLPGRWAEFVFGMVAAELYVTGRLGRYVSHAPYVSMFAIIPLGALGLLASARDWPVSHIIFGAVFFVLVSAVLAESDIITRIFSWRPLVAIGIMSYSLYLVHQPLVQVLAFLLRTRMHTSPDATFFALVLLLPFILFVARMLFVTVERRTISSTSTSVTMRWPEWLGAPAHVVRGWGELTIGWVLKTVSWQGFPVSQQRSHQNLGVSRHLEEQAEGVGIESDSVL